MAGALRGRLLEERQKRETERQNPSLFSRTLVLRQKDLNEHEGKK